MQETLSKNIEALAASEMRYRRLFESAQDGILILDRETGAITDANPYLLTLLGYSLAEFAGKQLWEIGPFRDKTANKAVVGVLQRSGYIRYEDLPLMTKGGQQIDVEFVSNVYSCGSQQVMQCNIRDIRPRKRAAEAERESQRALQASNEKFRQMAETINDAFWMRSPDMATVEYISPAFETIWGRSPDSLRANADQWTDFVLPEDREYARAGFARLTQDAPQINLEYRIVRPDGEVRWVLTRGFQVRDAAGCLIHLTGVSKDITARKNAETALTASEAKYHSLFENMLEGYAYCRTVFEQDRLVDFVYLEVNAAFETLTNLKDVVGKKVSAVLPGLLDNAPELFELYGRVASTGAPEKCETYVEALDLWLSIGAYSQRPEYFVAVFENITERKKADAALLASEADFRHLAEAMPQIVWITRADGWNIYFNQRWMDYTGLALEQSLGHGWNTPFHADDQARAWQAWQDATATGDTYSLECRIRSATGAYRWWLVRGVPFKDDAGIIVKWFGTCTDIHDLKVAEQKISHANAELQSLNNKLELRVGQRTKELVAATTEANKANQAKSEFLSRMSHELRTPLNAILGFSQILEGRDLDPRDTECVELISKGGRHLLELINEILDISRIEAGGISLSIEPVELEAVLAESFALVRPLAQDLELDMRNLATQLRGVHVMADRQRLKQVLINLLANAVKYNRHGGQVTLACDTTPADLMRIEVTDTGVGLTPAELGKIFVPFERLGAVKAGIEGTGLGLVLSRRLIESMDGSISVESMPSKGSTFSIELPLAEPMPAAIELADGVETMPGTPVTDGHEVTLVVLSIEDNLSNARLIEAIFDARPGVRLISAMQGGVGLDLARQHSPNLIMLDLNLPDMDGLEVLRRLRLYPETADIPVVIVSADATPSQIENLLAAGAVAYLTKPLNVREVLRLIDEQLLALASRKIPDTLFPVPSGKRA